VLELRRPQAADAAVQPSEDGIGLDLNRPPRLLPSKGPGARSLPASPARP